MKHSKIFVVLFISFTACNKANLPSLNTEDSNQKLTQIVGDSSFVPTYFQNFEYENGKISKVTVWNVNSLDTEIVNFEYSGNDYIRAVNQKRPDNYNEYFINSAGLPIKMIYHHIWFDSTLASEYDFFYNQKSGHLDSITNGEHTFKFVVKYNGENIEEIIKLPHTVNTTDSFSFTYNDNLNAFKDTDPLLYIHQNTFWNGFYYDLTIMPKIFSKNMLSGFSTKFDVVSTYTVNYSTINNNQLKDLQFLNIDTAYSAYMSHYLYQ